ncbi:MAG: PKD domain-containing protein [Ginsengibacter sp.]
MNANRIYTRKTLGLDNMVWIFMILIVIMAVGLLSYRLADRKECVPFTFNIKAISINSGSVFYTDETLSFSASLNAQNIQWNFGDNSNLQTGQYVTHRFKNPGKFFVTASTVPGCETIKEIIVKVPLPAPVVIDSANGDTGEKVIGHTTTFTGTNEVYVCSEIGTSYDWAIVNRPAIRPKSLGSTASFLFTNAGKYTIQVTVDNDRNKRYFKDITVENVATVKNEVPDNIKRLIPLPEIQPEPPVENTKPVPPAQPQLPVPEAPSNKTIALGNVAFRDYLQKVMNNEMNASDFDKYLCGGGSTKVILNGDKNDIQTFTSLCKFLKEGKVKKMVFFKKKIKLESVALHRDNEGCVTLIDVKYD